MNEMTKKTRRQDKDLNRYDSILNQCLLDSVLEVLNCERHYGDQGEPLLWSNRTRIIKYKYTETEMSKKMLQNTVENKIKELANTKMGLIPENSEYENEIINYEREKRLINCITKNKLNEEEETWKNLDIEETQVKIELSELVIEQLLNEVVEILEHVTLSRTNPELYQNKSIYGCEDIPRLPFQGSNLNMNDEMNR